MKQTILNLNNPKVASFYELSLNKFRGQFKDVVSISQLYVNKDGKVFAGEWKDSNGVINFNAGFAADAVKVVTFITK